MMYSSQFRLYSGVRQGSVLLLARLMDQYCFARCRLSASSVFYMMMDNIDHWLGHIVLSIQDQIFRKKKV